jgi:NADH-quinone oxidoreductase subunit M
MFNSLFNLYLLPIIISLPLFGAIFILLFTSNKNIQFTRQIGLFFSFITFILSLFLWVGFDRNYVRFQFVYDFVWVSSTNLSFSLGVDGISIFFVLLTTLLISICLLASWDSVNKFYKEYVIAFLVMESFLILVF